MDVKEFYEKTEEFAKKIVVLAANEGLTVKELCKAVDAAKAIAGYSPVNKDSLDKPDYPSRYFTDDGFDID